jgi:hypothetical protein
MSHCKTVEFLYALIPLKRWRSFLIRRHIEKCPGCLAGLASREEAGGLLVQEAGANVSRSFWSGVEAAIAEDSGGERGGDKILPPLPGFRWGWAVATAFLGVLLIGLFFLRDFQPERVSADTVQARFELEYVRVGGQPANAVVYQPQGSDMIIVWAEKNL